MGDEENVMPTIKKYLKKILPSSLRKLIRTTATYEVFYWSLQDYFFAISFALLPKKHNLKVSIVIPSHKNIQFLKEAVASALNQTYKNIEVLVMTDVPEEGAENSIKEFLPKIRFFREPQVLEIDKFNELIKRSSGDAIVFLCDDDRLDPKFVEKTIFALSMSKADIVYTDVQVFGEQKYCWKTGEWKKENFQNGTPIPITALFKKKVWKEIGGYEAVVYCDWDFWWRAFEHGFKASHLKESLFFYRIHRGQATDSIDSIKAKEEMHKKISTIKSSRDS